MTRNAGGSSLLQLGSKLYLHKDSPGSTAPLAHLVRSVQQGDPLAPVTVIGPSTYANLTLRRGLARSGFANVRFLVFSRLSEFLGSPSLAAQDRKPLTSIIECASVRAVTRQASGALAGHASHPSTIHSIKNTFRQLRHTSDTALDRLAAQDPLREEIVKLYRMFQDQTLGYYDAEDLAQASADAVRSGSAAALGDLGFILFYRIRGMTQGEKQVVRDLARLNSCAVFLGLTGDPDADEPVESLAQELSPFLGAPERGASSDGNVLTALSPAGKRLLITPDPHEEVRWVIRQIAHKAETGTPFHRVAVLYGAATPYNTLVREELQLSGIPVSGPNPFPLGGTAVGRTLTGLIQLSDSEFPRDQVMSWLMGCPVRPRETKDRENFSPSNWDAISKKAGVVAGLGQWSERLNRYASDIERYARGREEKGDIAEAQANLMLTEAQSARDLQQFIETLARDSIHPPGGNTWSQLADWASNLLQLYLMPPDQMPPPEADAFRKVKDILEGLESADEVDSSPTFGAFRENLEEALRSSAGHSGATGQGVFVGPISSATAMDFDVVHIVGMIEGAVPAPVRDDPLIPDRERQAAGGPAEGLPLQHVRQSEERYAFLSALGSAPETTLSFPRANPAGQRAHYPSRWFLELASLLEGSRVTSSGLGKLGNRTWLTIIPSMERALESVVSAAPADQHDYDLERLWRWTSSGQEVQAHPLAASGALARSLRLGRSRYRSSGFTEWDGNLSGAVDDTGLTKRLADTALSPTSLEMWAGCPFSYFLGHVLRISALEDPEEIFSITPMHKGSLVHKVLEDFIAEAKKADTLPQPGQPWNAQHRAALGRIARDNFHRAEAEGVTGKPLMWQLEQEAILNDLYSFLEEDTRLRSRFDLSPSHFEARFGLGGDSWPAPELWVGDSVPIRFRGVIDRIDSSYSGEDILVMDYKTGSPDPYSGLKADPIDRGRRLQLAVYSLAVREALGANARIRAAYWFVSSRGSFTIVPDNPVDMAEPDTVERFKEGVSAIVSGIRGGVFPANPGREENQDFHNCRHCDFKTLCPSRKDTLWARKKGHPILGDYLELSGEVSS